MSVDLIQPFTQLGSTGVAMLLLWWVYRDTSMRLDKKDEAFRLLEREVRIEISTQLISSTSALRDNAKIMERVMERISEK